LNNPSVLILYDSGHGCALFLVESSLQPTSYYANHTKVSLHPTQKNPKLVLPLFNSSEQTLSTKKHVN